MIPLSERRGRIMADLLSLSSTQKVVFPAQGLDPARNQQHRPQQFS